MTDDRDQMGEIGRDRGGFIRPTFAKASAGKMAVLTTF